ncbi:ceramidase-domain-containing protein [Gymnopilus junonius]|uniref:Ceramidase-domain-containing protein n=1 Tax=Gymnopilus junonius TaxID=109634 RepID=A0A9P5NXK9_GYMJU|nr:ceramidase-domain-containing protein [Gymnopilus junonius]
MMNLAHIAPWLQKTGAYGPVTATLDWCEVNHQFSPYIAEMANTFSNLFTVGISLVGYLEAVRQGLPSRYSSGYTGVALVGIGSFFFHATLLFQAQLADELPMIYVASMSLFLLWDSQPGFGLKKLRTKFLIVLLVLFDILFTWSYMVYRNPIYHQVIFAFLVISTAFRITYILKLTNARVRIPEQKKGRSSDFSAPALPLGWPAAFLLEGHSWWHVFTGLGTYYMFIGIQRTTLSTKDDPKSYDVYYRFGLPHVSKNTEKARIS